MNYQNLPQQSFQSILDAMRKRVNQTPNHTIKSPNLKQIDLHKLWLLSK